MQIIVGNIFHSRCQTLVNPVNCVGIMGAGLAKEFKLRFPDMFDDYKKRCANHEVKLGKPYLFARDVEPWILNFPTKNHWKDLSHEQIIIEGLTKLAINYKHLNVTSLAVPLLGTGLGRLSWKHVGKTIAYQLHTYFDIHTELYVQTNEQKQFIEKGILYE